MVVLGSVFALLWLLLLDLRNRKRVLHNSACNCMEGRGVMPEDALIQSIMFCDA